jgi:alkylation response protein AidB-like acyl-CoA dehydrogenase
MMDLTPSPQEEAYRNRARTWLEANVPKSFEGEKSIANPDYVEYLCSWQRALAEGGWLGITWPEEFGGQGLGGIEQSIFNEEEAKAEAPYLIGRVGVALIGPTIAMVGTPEQKERHLSKIINCEEIWVQGFSEPNAGSDLGSLACRAVRDGDHFIVNGQKTWTSYAQVADWIFLLVRTDPDASKYKGITCLLVNMKSEGVSVRSLRMMSGDSAFNEVFFSDVRVPVENVLGEIDGGWKVAITALMHERMNLGGSIPVELSRFLAQIVDVARQRGLTNDPVVRQKLAKAILDLEVFKMTSARAMSAVGKGQAPGPEGSILKLFWSNYNQWLVHAALEIAGPFGQLAPEKFGGLSYHYLRSRGNSIEAGTNEVLKNTIANRVLGMPKSY